MRIRRFALVFCLLAVVASAAAARAEPQWLTLPPTPSLPKPAQNGYAPVNGIRIWYATFGRGKPVLLPHGGLANSNYWGNQVPALAKGYRVVVMDSRGHGRGVALLGGPAMMDAVLRRADYVVIAMPVTPESKGAIGRRELALMKPTAFLVNVARAEIVDEVSCFDALAYRAIARAALDDWYRYPSVSRPTPPVARPFHEFAKRADDPACLGLDRRHARRRRAADRREHPARRARQTATHLVR